MLYAFMAYENYEVRNFVYAISLAISPARLTIFIRIYLKYLLFTVNYSLYFLLRLIQATWYSYHGESRLRTWNQGRKITLQLSLELELSSTL